MAGFKRKFREDIVIFGDVGGMSCSSSGVSKVRFRRILFSCFRFGCGSICCFEMFRGGFGDFYEVVRYLEFFMLFIFSVE